MKNYDHNKIEKKWQKEWDKQGIYTAKNSYTKKKFYGLIEFPYPSGAGLHVGHIRSNTAMDIITRKRRMEGYNVLFPIGWDAFGLPTENYAIKTGKQPEKVTKENTDMFRKQLKALGFGFDWSREVNTTDPAYYKWTQWIFLQMYKKGLAYKAKSTINWCPKDKIGLANEEVVNGACERCRTPTIKKEKEQWMLGITKYADRLDKDLDTVDYLEKIKIQQRNWIGKSEGSEITFKIVFTHGQQSGFIPVFTTRADTLFGATYMVLAPEHPWVTLALDDNHVGVLNNTDEVRAYVAEAKKKDEIERTSDTKEKTGVELKGVKAINPGSGEEIPVFVADYVLAHYGTGAVMAVPAHDERDFQFAKKYNLRIKRVIEPSVIRTKVYINETMNTAEELKNIQNRLVNFEEIYTGTDGKLINSEQFNERSPEEARTKITNDVGGKIVTKYKLRDWVFSRQRYWGEPIPIIHCEKCGYVPVPEKDLPVILPKVKSYEPTDNGESPLATISKWVNTTCPTCKGKAKRETDTMPNWAGSSWYYLRYTDPTNTKEFASKKNLDYFTPVDWYNGGMEHTTLHLLYSRFWHKFLFDLKLVPTSEPYMKRTSQGMILAEDGAKISKTKGNGVDPIDIVKLYGADTLRVHEMFMGPFDQAVPWSGDTIIGSRRFLDKVWRVYEAKLANDFSQSGRAISKNKKSNSEEIRGLEKSLASEAQFQTLFHKTIKKVTEDIESMSFNTAISSMMVLVNEMDKESRIDVEDFKLFIKILSPFAPHIAEELWSLLGEKKSIHISAWSLWDAKKIIDDMMTIVIQVNGKVRGELYLSLSTTEEEVKIKVLQDDRILPWVEGKEIKRIVYVPGRVLNIVI